MLLDTHNKRWRNGAAIAALLALAVLASGCSSGGFGGPPPAPAPVAPAPGDAAAPPPASSPSFKDKIAGFFSGASQREPQPVTNTQGGPDVPCPLIDIREGASTLTVPPPSPDGESNAMALKYQGTFVRAARECAVVAKQMVIKVGIQGRIIVGPAGGPGQIEVPLRIAVVNEPPAGSKLILTKLIRMAVTVGPNAENTPFTHIEEGLSFPLPADTSALDTYIVYIGFDPVGAEAQSKPKPPPAAKSKANKPKPNPNTPTG